MTSRSTPGVAESFNFWPLLSPDGKSAQTHNAEATIRQGTFSTPSPPRAEPYVYDGYRLQCPSCAYSFLPLPCEPAFDMRVVPALIPCSPEQLKARLKKYKAKFPSRYRSEGRCRRRIRVLLASEVVKLRGLFIQPAKVKGAT